MLNQLDQEKLSRASRRNVVVRSFGGVTLMSLMSEKITPLLRKNPESVIVHVGMNDSIKMTSDTITTELLQLKHYIEGQLEDCKVCFALPIIRTDNGKARLTINRLNERMECLNAICCLNKNIDETCLGKSGQHI